MNELLMQAAYWVFIICGVSVAIFVAGWVMLLRCKHPSPSFPVNGVQKCFDCGKFRMYELDGHIGRWIR